MSIKKELPIFVVEGDEQIQIGEVVIEDWGRNPNYTQILIDIDVFPGERATMSRIVKWENIIEISKARYPKEGR